MKKKIVSIVLAIAVCICNLGNVSYAQSVEKNEMPIRSSVESEWNLLNVKFDKESPQQLSEIINISADIENAQEGFQYKFVWMKDSWKEWGYYRIFRKKIQWNGILKYRGIIIYT